MNPISVANPKIVELFRQGKVGILPTDTLYGIHGSVFHPDSIERIYQIRKRDPKKPFIILISRVTDLSIFKISLDSKTKEILYKIWPGKVSVVLPCSEKMFEYLHRGGNSLAFRIPETDILELLEKTGPLISTSANPEGSAPAKTIEEAEAYFGNEIDFYVNAGRLESPPSTLIKIEDGKIIVLREGAVKL